LPKVECQKRTTANNISHNGKWVMHENGEKFCGRVISWGGMQQVAARDESC
jgi:hypothetical protein